MRSNYLLLLLLLLFMSIYGCTKFSNEVSITHNQSEKFRSEIKELLDDNLEQIIDWSHYQINHFREKNENYHLLIYKTVNLNEFLVYTDLKNNKELKFIKLISTSSKYLEDISSIIIKDRNYNFEKSSLINSSKEFAKISSQSINGGSIKNLIDGGDLPEVTVTGYIPSKVDYVYFYDLSWIFNTNYSNSYINFEVVGESGYGGNGGANDQYDENNLPDKTPCPEMKKLASKSSFLDSISYLSTKTSSDHEEGFVMTRNSNGEYAYSKVVGNRGENWIDFNFNTNTIGFIHSHYDGLNFMPSPGDLRTFGLMVKSYTGNKSEIATEFTLGVVSSSGTYIIKIDDIEKFLLFYLTKLENQNEFSKVNDAYNVSPFYMSDQSKSDEWENSFTKFISTFQSGLTIYKSDENNQKWLPLVPNVFDKNVQYGKPCK